MLWDAGFGTWQGRLTTYPQLEIRPIEVREHLLLQPGNPASRIWMRARGDMPTGQSGWAAVLTYLSDYLLINAALILHVSEMPNEHLFVASLNHAMWFHLPADPSRWLLYETESSWAGEGRALIHGRFFSEAGQFVASVVQEAMIRTASIRLKGRSRAPNAPGLPPGLPLAVRRFGRRLLIHRIDPMLRPCLDRAWLPLQPGVRYEDAARDRVEILAKYHSPSCCASSLGHPLVQASGAAASGAPLLTA